MATTLPCGVLQAFKDAIKDNKKEAEEVSILAALKNKFKNARTEQTLRECNRLVDMISEHKGSNYEQEMARIILVDERCGLKLVQEPAPWGDPLATTQFVKKWGGIVSNGLGAKYPDPEEKQKQIQRAFKKKTLLLPLEERRQRLKSQGRDIQVSSSNSSMSSSDSEED